MNKKLLECSNYFLLNKEGFTFRVSGEGLKVPSRGYVVAITPLVKDAENMDIHAVISYITKNQTMNVLGEEYYLHAGGWFDEDEDEFVVDLSVVASDIEKAIKIGKLTDQKAIYDIDNELYMHLKNKGA